MYQLYYFFSFFFFFFLGGGGGGENFKKQDLCFLAITRKLKKGASKQVAFTGYNFPVDTNILINTRIKNVDKKGILSPV